MHSHYATDKRDTERQRKTFAYSRKAELSFARSLRSVSKQIGSIIGAYDPDSPAFNAHVFEAMRRYSDLIRPWAIATSRRMVLEVARRDEAVWAQLAKEMGASLREEIKSAPTGEALRKRMAESVHYITSLPTDAAKRVHKLTMERMSNSGRAKELAEEIQRSGQVSESRATLIARTETARTSSLLVQVRAEHVGAEGYIWRTARDSDVRRSHKNMEGKFVRFDEPPELSDGTVTHAGQIYNCFPGDTLVRLTDDAHSLLRAFYQGDVVDIFTTGCSKPLTATLNHPMLTERGWLPAGTIQQGDNLIQADPQRNSPTQVNTDKSLLISFDELFATMAGKRHFKRASAEVNLYGDAINGEVDHIRSDTSLLRDFEAARSHRIADLFFPVSDVIPNTAGFRSDLQISEALSSSFFNESSLSFLGSLTHTNEHAFSTATRRDIVIDQHAAHGPSIDPVMFGERKLAFTPTVTPDYFRPVRVEVLRRRSFSGHVFTLSTGRGYYTTTESRLVSKNCRCWMEVVLPDKFT